jgi:hypothetical protein
MSIIPWFIKYKPSKFTELQLLDDSGFKFLEWLRTAQRGSILNLIGPIGCGKTSLVYTGAKAIKYKVIEYENIQSEELKSIEKSRNFENHRFLILADESDIHYTLLLQKFRNFSIPIVFTTTNFASKDLKSIKMPCANSEIVLNIIKKILKEEKRQLDDKFILRISEICCYDIRLIINYCQIFSRSPNIKDLIIIDKIASQNISSMCRSMLSREISLVGLENMYSEKLQNLCLSSALENNNDPALIKAIESISEFAGYPEKFKFLSLENLNRLRSEFIYKKEEQPQITEFHEYEDPLHYLPLYHRDLYNYKSILHLQSIFNRYKPRQLSAIDQEIKDYVATGNIDSRMFKYKYNIGSSSAVKKDMTLNEIFDL